MPTKVIMPHMGVTTVEGTIVRWLKKEGDEVRQGEGLVEILTDKVNTQIESPSAGVVLKIVAPEGTVVPVTQSLCWIGLRGEHIAGDDRSTPVQESAETVHASVPGGGRVEEGYVLASPAAKRLAREHGVDLARIGGTGPAGRVVEDDVLRYVAASVPAHPGAGPERFLASPVARNLAADLGVDLTTLKGNGPRGRIVRDDVLAAAQANQTTARVPATQAAPAAPASRLPLAGLRRTIAQRMSQSARTVARVTHTTEADVTDTVKMREQLAEEGERRNGLRVTYTDIVVKIVAGALRRHPLINARLWEEEIELLDEVNVGIAVAVPEGLVVPVVHGADGKDLMSIARESREKVERARAGTLTRDDVSGGSFTVTNLGAYEVDAFTPIINLPEVAILGVGRIVEKPAIYEGQFARRWMMYLSLSFDHRVVDGAPAAEFLRDVKHGLEKPYVP